MMEVAIDIGQFPPEGWRSAFDSDARVRMGALYDGVKPV